MDFLFKQNAVDWFAGHERHHDRVVCENSAEARFRKITADNVVAEPFRSLPTNRQEPILGTEVHVRQAPAMDPLPPPLAFFLLLVSGWVNRQQQAVIDYLLEENRVLRAAHGPRRLRLTDDQRRRLAVKGKVLGRRRLADIAGIVTPDTILRWYRTARRQEIRRLEDSDAPVARAPSRTSPRSWSAWRTRIRPGATRASAAG